MKKVFVTGATGFIGAALCKRLLEEGLPVHGTVRSIGPTILPQGAVSVQLESIEKKYEWDTITNDTETVVHLAARVHVMKNSVADLFSEYCKVNVSGSESLAQAAATCGVKRFIFMSTVKVNGEESAKTYKETDKPAPRDPYAISKLQAEQRLRKIAAESGMELVILRPPLVYGPGVKASFLRLLKVVERGIPLPLASINNRRSLIYLENLLDAIVTCINHPRAAGQTFLINDGRDLSTPELIRLMAETMGRKARLFSFPPGMLKTTGKITGRSAEIDRLIGSLCVDSSKIRTMLGWKPPYRQEEGIRETVLWYKKNGKGQRTDVRW